MTNKIEISRGLAQFALNAVEYLALRGDDVGTSNVPVADELRALLAAPVVEHQPVAFIQIPKNVEKYGHGDQPDRLSFGKPGQFFVDGKSPMFDFVPLYTSPPAPVAVVLPGYMPGDTEDSDVLTDCRNEGWNACLDKVKELNS